MGDGERTVSATLADVLTSAHAGSLNGQIRDNLVATERENLTVLAPGEAEMVMLLEGLPALLDALSEAGVDVAVIAAPAVLEDPAATLMVWSTRRALWVVESGSTTTEEAREANARLELAGAGAFGIAMVRERG